MSDELYVQRDGDGPALVMLHGLLGSGQNFGAVTRLLAEQFSVYRIDLRNHGQSFHHHDVRYEVMADDVCWTLDRLGLTQVGLFGHSMGGKVAMVLAQRFPARVRRLLVEDIAPRRYLSIHADILAAMASVPLSACASRRDVDDGLAEHIPSSQVRQFVLTNLVRGADGFVWRVGLQALLDGRDALRDYPDGLPAFSGPVRFQYGRQSDYLTALDLDWIRTCFPHASLEAFDSGHWIHFEQAAAFVQSTREFFSAES